MTTPLEFAKALLDAGGWPQSDNNIEAVVAWSALEGGHYYNSARYNPMNTMQSMPGSHDAVGKVQAYTSWDQGLAATLKTLNNGLYSNVIANLSASAPPDDTLASLTTWTGGTPYSLGHSLALFNNYANHHDPTGESLSYSASSTSSIKKVFIGALLAGLVYWGFKK